MGAVGSPRARFEAFRENYMRFKATAIALAVVAAIGYGVHERKELGRQQQAAAPTPRGRAARALRRC